MNSVVELRVSCTGEFSFSNSMYMLVRMNQHVTSTQDSGSILSVTFASSLIKVKRNFDKFVVRNIA